MDMITKAKLHQAGMLLRGLLAETLPDHTRGTARESSDIPLGEPNTLKKFDRDALHRHVDTGRVLCVSRRFVTELVATIGATLGREE